jgi:hypothetical protein
MANPAMGSELSAGCGRASHDAVLDWREERRA